MVKFNPTIILTVPGILAQLNSDINYADVFEHECRADSMRAWIKKEDLANSVLGVKTLAQSP
jgi:hypothetical protein